MDDIGLVIDDLWEQWRQLVAPKYEKHLVTMKPGIVLVNGEILAEVIVVIIDDMKNEKTMRDCCGSSLKGYQIVITDKRS